MGSRYRGRGLIFNDNEEYRKSSSLIVMSIKLYNMTQQNFSILMQMRLVVYRILKFAGVRPQNYIT